MPAPEGFSKALRQSASRCHRPHGTAQNERYADGSLIGRGIRPDHTAGLAIQHERRIHIHITEDHAILVNKIRSK